jgi:hypothetical protein
VISSSQGAEYAFESSEQSNGLFTYSLMEALDGKATPNKDGQITISTVGDYVKKRVQDLTKGKQNPNLRGVNLEEDFTLSSTEDASSHVVDVSTATVVLKALPSGSAIERCALISSRTALSDPETKRSSKGFCTAFEKIELNLKTPPDAIWIPGSIWSDKSVNALVSEDVRLTLTVRAIRTGCSEDGLTRTTE